MANAILWVRTAAFLGVVAVVLGAMGSHMLKSRLTLTQIDAYKIAVHYQIIHAIVILLVSVLSYKLQSVWVERANWFFLVGVFFFSGSIYTLLFVKASKCIGVLTPVGGGCLILGWSCLFIATFS